MPRNGVYTSAEERQRVRQSYYATSEKEAGVAHLWHLQQLADIRFNPNHTIQDVPEVDFRSSGSPSDVYRDLFAQRAAQQIQHDEARIYEQNKVVYRNIVLASDDEARRARHMNLVPTDDQVKRFDNIQQQTLHRTQDRERRQRVVAAENKKLLDHLISVPPHVRPTKELDTWYNTVHKKRLAQLSKFKPAEPYAGARVLEGSAGYAAARREYMTGSGPDYGATPPLIRGHPYPDQTVGEAARTAPSALRPAVSGTAYNGVPLSRHTSGAGRHTTNNSNNNNCATAHEDAVSSTSSGRRQSRRQQQQQRPPWQPLAATDIPLLHYGADQQLRGRSSSSTHNHNVASSNGNGHGASALTATTATQQNSNINTTQSTLGSGRGRSPQTLQRFDSAVSRTSSSAQRDLFPSTQTSPAERIQVLHASYNNTNTTNNGQGYTGSRSGSVSKNTSSRRDGDVRRVTAQEEGGVTQLWRRAVQDRYSSAPKREYGNRSRNLSDGGDLAKLPPSARASTPSAALTSRADTHSPPLDQQDHPPHAPPQRRLSAKPKKGSGSGRPAASARPPQVAVRAAPSGPLTADVPAEEDVGLGAEEGEGDGSAMEESDKDEATAMRALMDGWHRRNEGGGGAYAPF